MVEYYFLSKFKKRGKKNRKRIKLIRVSLSIYFSGDFKLVEG
jgi:hypothetical protein